MKQLFRGLRLKPWLVNIQVEADCIMMWTKTDEIDGKHVPRPESVAHLAEELAQLKGVEGIQVYKHIPPDGNEPVINGIRIPLPQRSHEE